MNYRDDLIIRAIIICDVVDSQCYRREIFFFLVGIPGAILKFSPNILGNLVVGLAVRVRCVLSPSERKKRTAIVDLQILIIPLVHPLMHGWCTY